MTAAALDITHSVLIVSQRRKGQTLSAQCADATQYYYSVTTAHHTHSHYLSPFSPLTIPVIFPLSTEQTQDSIRLRIHTPRPLKEKKNLLTVKPWVNTRSYSAAANRK